MQLSTAAGSQMEVGEIPMTNAEFPAASARCAFRWPGCVLPGQGECLTLQVRRGKVPAREALSSLPRRADIAFLPPASCAH